MALDPSPRRAGASPPSPSSTPSFSLLRDVRHVRVGLSPFTRLSPFGSLSARSSVCPAARPLLRELFRQKRPPAPRAPLRVVVPALVQVRLAALDQAFSDSAWPARPAAQDVLLDWRTLAPPPSRSAHPRADAARHHAGPRHRRRAGLRAVRHHRAAVVCGGSPYAAYARCKRFRFRFRRRGRRTPVGCLKNVLFGSSFRGWSGSHVLKREPS